MHRYQPFSTQFGAHTQNSREVGEANSTCIIPAASKKSFSTKRQWEKYSSTLQSRLSKWISDWQSLASVYQTSLRVLYFYKPWKLAGKYRKGQTFVWENVNGHFSGSYHVQYESLAIFQVRFNKFTKTLGEVHDLVKCSFKYWNNQFRSISV
jgi:hypothetical protein